MKYADKEHARRAVRNVRALIQESLDRRNEWRDKIGIKPLVLMGPDEIGTSENVVALVGGDCTVWLTMEVSVPDSAAGEAGPQPGKDRGPNSKPGLEFGDVLRGLAGEISRLEKQVIGGANQVMDAAVLAVRERELQDENEKLKRQNRHLEVVNHNLRNSLQGAQAQAARSDEERAQVETRVMVLESANSLLRAQLAEQAQMLKDYQG